MNRNCESSGTIVHEIGANHSSESSPISVKSNSPYQNLKIHHRHRHRSHHRHHRMAKRKVDMRDFEILKVLGTGAYGKVCCLCPFYTFVYLLKKILLGIFGTQNWWLRSWKIVCNEGVEKVFCCDETENIRTY